LLRRGVYPEGNNEQEGQAFVVLLLYSTIYPKKKPEKGEQQTPYFSKKLPKALY